jgi:hypothetical protein
MQDRLLGSAEEPSESLKSVPLFEDEQSPDLSLDLASGGLESPGESVGLGNHRPAAHTRSAAADRALEMRKRAHSHGSKL